MRVVWQIGVALSAVAFMSGLARAGERSWDEIELTTGHVLTGSITREGTDYQVRRRWGSVRVPVDEVVRVRLAQDPLDELARMKAARMQLGTAEERFAYATLLNDLRYRAEAREAYTRVLALDQDHRGANLALGRVSFDGKWMTPAERHRAQSARMLALGFVSHEGEWLQPAERDRRVAAAKRIEAQRQAAARAALANRRRAERERALAATLLEERRARAARERADAAERRAAANAAQVQQQPAFANNAPLTRRGNILNLGVVNRGNRRGIGNRGAWCPPRRNVRRGWGRNRNRGNWRAGNRRRAARQASQARQARQPRQSRRAPQRQARQPRQNRPAPQRQARQPQVRRPVVAAPRMQRLPLGARRR